MRRLLTRPAVLLAVALGVGGAFGGCSSLDEWQRQAIFNPARDNPRWFSEPISGTEEYDVELRRLELLDVGNRLRDARLQFFERRLGVVVLGRLVARQAGRGTLREVARNAHLGRQREHVGEQPRVDQHRGVDLARNRVRRALVEDVRQVAEHADEQRCGQRMHQAGHFFPPRFLFRFSMVPRQLGAPQWQA